MFPDICIFYQRNTSIQLNAHILTIRRARSHIYAMNFLKIKSFIKISICVVLQILFLIYVCIYIYI